jgi:hypothetical protein
MNVVVEEFVVDFKDLRWMEKMKKIRNKDTLFYFRLE